VPAADGGRISIDLPPGETDPAATRDGDPDEQPPES
jgi:hypothetical protein